MQKTISFLFINLFFISSLCGQDLILLLNGDSIQGRIIEINNLNIVYGCIQKPDSICHVSNSFVRKVLFADGKEKVIKHLGESSDLSFLRGDSTLIFIEGNSYFYKGLRIKHNDLEAIYRPLKDSMLIELFYKGINMKQGSSFMKFMPIPLGVVGYALFIFGLVPTNNILSTEYKYGNSRFVLPGVVLMGSALACGIGGIITHKRYKRILKKSVVRYNEVISKHQLY